MPILFYINGQPGVVFARRNWPHVPRVDDVVQFASIYYRVVLVTWLSAQQNGEELDDLPEVQIGLAEIVAPGARSLGKDGSGKGETGEEGKEEEGRRGRRERMKKEESCGICRFWLVWETPHIAGCPLDGHCRRKPDTVGKTSDEWCGQFKPPKKRRKAQ